MKQSFNYYKSTMQGKKVEPINNNNGQTTGGYGIKFANSFIE